MIRQGYAATASIGGPAHSGPPRVDLARLSLPRARRHPLRGALRVLLALLKVGVVLPLGIAVAAAVWLVVQLLKL